MEACDRILPRDNQVTIRWVPAHIKVEGNEKADAYAWAAAARTAPCCDEETPTELRHEASLSYMTRTATETRSRALEEWIKGNVRAERRYSPPRVKASAASAYATPGKNWPDASTSSWSATPTLGPTFTGWG